MVAAAGPAQGLRVQAEPLLWVLLYGRTCRRLQAEEVR